MAIKRSYVTVPAGIVTSLAVLIWVFGHPFGSEYSGGCYGESSPPDGYLIRVTKALPAGAVVQQQDLMLQPIWLDSRFADEASSRRRVDYIMSKRESRIAHGYKLPRDVQRYEPLARDELNLKPVVLDQP